MMLSKGREFRWIRQWFLCDWGTALLLEWYQRPRSDIMFWVNGFLVGLTGITSIKSVERAVGLAGVRANGGLEQRNTGPA